ncbi:MAG: PHP domain-containing protein, partial [Thiohalospira sp.]
MSDAPACAELHCLSRFSFLRGASDPAELVATAAERGYTALALTDECSLAGAVRAHEAAREHGLPLIHGSELHLAAGDGLPPLHLVLLAADAGGYANLAGLITT